MSSTKFIFSLYLFVCGQSLLAQKLDGLSSVYKEHFFPTSLSIINESPEKLHMNADQYFDFQNRIPKNIRTVCVVLNTHDTSSILISWEAGYKNYLGLYHYQRDRPLDLEDEAYGEWYIIEADFSQITWLRRFYSDALKYYSQPQAHFYYRDCFGGEYLFFKTGRDTALFGLNSVYNGKLKQSFEDFHLSLIQALMKGAEKEVLDANFHSYLRAFYHQGNVTTIPAKPSAKAFPKLNSRYNLLHTLADTNDLILVLYEGTPNLFPLTATMERYIIISEEGNITLVQAEKRGRYINPDFKVFADTSVGTNWRIQCLDTILTAPVFQNPQYLLKGNAQLLDSLPEEEVFHFKLKRMHLIQGRNFTPFYSSDAWENEEFSSLPNYSEQGEFLKIWETLWALFPEES